MNPALKDILRLTIPVGVGYLPAGFAFGVLAAQAGLQMSLILAMSVFVFAGALQFATVPMLVAATDLTTIALTTLLINLRHVLYAIPLLDRLPRRRLAKAYLICTLTDENYSLLTSLSEQFGKKAGHWLCFINHGYWVLGTFIGAALGVQAAHWIPHLDLALPALFTILAMDQYMMKRRLYPMIVGLTAYLFAHYAVPAYALTVALGLSLGVLLVFSPRHRPDNTSMKAES